MQSENYDTEEPSVPELIRVPATVEEMVPPRPTDIITEMASFLRAHWPDIVGYFQAISGEIPSKNGKPWLDESECVFKIQALARDNGYSLLSGANAYAIWKAMRRAYKRNTGIPVWQLEAQCRRLLLERRRDLEDQVAAE
jgi:hypothetical protein